VSISPGDLVFGDAEGVVIIPSHIEKQVLDEVYRRISNEKRILIDSLEMTDEHRERILSSCEQAAEKHIIITHGTDTMTDTAALVGRAMAQSPDGPLRGKTIVFTGAMIPYTISGSDALFNLGTAFSAVQILNPGVYIVMNAAIFNWNDVRKNKEEGRFETIG
jgi:L-asparaginase